MVARCTEHLKTTDSDDREKKGNGNMCISPLMEQTHSVVDVDKAKEKDGEGCRYHSRIVEQEQSVVIVDRGEMEDPSSTNSQSSSSDHSGELERCSERGSIVDDREDMMLEMCAGQLLEALDSLHPSSSSSGTCNNSSSSGNGSNSSSAQQQEQQTYVALK